MGRKTRAKRRRAKLKNVEKVSLSQNIKPFLSFRHPITRFCLLFLVLLVVFSFLLSLELVKQYVYNPLTTLIASHAAWVLKTIGMNVHASGITIKFRGHHTYFSIKAKKVQFLKLSFVI